MDMNINKIAKLSNLKADAIKPYLNESLSAPQVCMEKSSRNFNENVLRSITNTAFLYYSGGERLKQINQESNEIKTFYNNNKIELQSLYDNVNNQLGCSNKLGDSVLNVEFSDSNNSDMSLYTDRYGEEVSFNSIIKAGRELALPCVIQQSAISHNNVNNASCSISEQNSNGIKIFNNTKFDFIIDQSYDTYWKEEVIASSILNNVSTPSSIVSYGAICELRITLESIRRVNTITLDTFSKFPMELCYVKYTESDNPFETKKQFISGVNVPGTPLWETNNLIFDKCTIHFPKTIVKNIYIGFTQPHYEPCNVLASRSMVTTNEYKYTDFIDSNSQLNCEVLDDDTQVEINGFKYEYGFSDIGATYSDYASKGIYVSKSYPADGSICSVNIETDECEPLSLDDYYKYITDIEYYIAFNKTPSTTDWISIFPTNKNEVKCEKLFAMNDFCSFRFKASKLNEVYINGKILPVADYKIKYEASTDKILGICIPNFNGNSIYTVAYIPVDDSKILFLGNKQSSITTITDIVHCDNNASYKLSQEPYNEKIEIEIVNSETNERFTEKAGEITNMSKDKANFEFQGKQLQYYINRNNVIINRNLDPKYTILARYSTYGSFLTIKTILRRNTTAYRDLTNSVRKLKIKTNVY